MQVLTVLCVALLLVGCRGGDNVQECLPRMKTWIAEQQKLYPKDRPSDPDKMLYFLHVPRTAGRTTHNCFLLPSTPPSRRCAKSYDGLKYDISLPDCGLIASHDDFSAMATLPNTAAVFTSIRDPVARFLSAYEFAVELGGREAIRTVPGRAPDKNQGKTSTKEVWPWSYLQPVMAEDMAPRVRSQILHCAFGP
jgi:protein-tyrosine sulfotransferase